MNKKSDLSLRIMLANAELEHFRSFMPSSESPNFSAVARQNGLSRHTVSKLWKQMTQPESEREEPKVRKKKGSKLDPYYEEIASRMKNPNRTMMDVFKELQEKYGKEVFSSYSTLKSFVRTHQLGRDHTPASLHGE